MRGLLYRNRVVWAGGERCGVGWLVTGDGDRVGGKEAATERRRHVSVVTTDEAIGTRLEGRDDVDLPAFAPFGNGPQVLVIVGGGDKDGLGPLALRGTNGGPEEAVGVTVPVPVRKGHQLFEGTGAGVVPPTEAVGAGCASAVEEKVIHFRHVNRQPFGLGAARRRVIQAGARREGPEVVDPNLA
jgi:hypothetical protein